MRHLLFCWGEGGRTFAPGQAGTPRYPVTLQVGKGPQGKQNSGSAGGHQRYQRLPMTNEHACELQLEQAIPLQVQEQRQHCRPTLRRAQRQTARGELQQRLYS